MRPPSQSQLLKRGGGEIWLQWKVSDLVRQSILCYRQAQKAPELSLALLTKAALCCFSAAWVLNTLSTVCHNHKQCCPQHHSSGSWMLWIAMLSMYVQSFLYLHKPSFDYGKKTFQYFPTIVTSKNQTSVSLYCATFISFNLHEFLK